MIIIPFEPYFVLGQGDKSEEIELEIEEFGDIIVGAFLDTYENLPLKTMLGYQFAADHCTNVNFFFYQDDDIFMKFDSFLDTQDLTSPDPFMICPMGGSPPSSPTTVSSDSIYEVFNLFSSVRTTSASITRQSIYYHLNIG